MVSKVTLIDSMGTDLSVVNAARVSFAKKSANIPIKTITYTNLKDHTASLFL